MEDALNLDNHNEETIIPYKKLYKEPFVPRPLYLPNEPITIKIVDVDAAGSYNILNPYLYTIEVKHGDYQWTIYRRYKHFQHLHQQIQLLRAALNIPFPTKNHREQRASFKVSTRSNTNPILVRFPLRPEALISPEELPSRKKQLENYLNAILTNPVFCEHNETRNFLEVSIISFVDQMGPKRKEGVINKKRIDRVYTGCLQTIFSGMRIFGMWRKRWLFVKDSCVGYFGEDGEEIRCVLLMDQGFKVAAGVSHTGSNSGLSISNLSRQMIIKGWTRRKAAEWLDCIEKAMTTTGAEFISANRFGSYAPVRSESPCTWFVDGCDYMNTVADAIELAREEIFIADWWLSPEIYLKRPQVDREKWRLDVMLHRKAEEGVRIFVLLYKEVEMGLSINSLYTKRQLASRHPNIKVLRHPDHVASGVLLWAHHEKLVIVDQTVAFVGGIDLCYGRWDDKQHKLTDLGGEPVKNEHYGLMKMVQSSHTVGQHVPSALLQLAKAANRVTMGTVTSIPSDKINEPGRIATVVERMRTRGREWADEFIDKNRNLVGRGRADSEITLNRPDSMNEDEASLGGIAETREDGSPDSGNQARPLTKMWIGKDYTNFIVKDFSQLDQPLIDAVDRTSTPRMPWHDIALLVTGSAARDAARHFIQRWNAVKIEKVKIDPSYPFLMPKSYHQRFGPLRYFNYDKATKRTECQVLRSASTWSSGTRTTEDSIHQAYIDSIKNAKHYIYIENQFFITLAGGSGNELCNKIGRALFDRILLAHKNRTCFRVYVVMPLLPGFEGEIGTGTGTAIQAIAHWNYASICRGNNSLMGKLRGAHIDPLAYVSFYGLRTHSELHNQPITELIYVHSKLMIVDDNLVICGSANINDRSLSGKRDSEVALIVKDIEFVKSTMNKHQYMAGRFALSLRKRLFREHLGVETDESGVDSVDISDPIADSFYKGTWMHRAAVNTNIYDKVFRCSPSDSITSFEKLNAMKSNLSLAITDPVSARTHLSEIKGHLVLLPLLFLGEENLTPGAGTAESLMPTSLWT